jgi:hypothetical protein
MILKLIAAFGVVSTLVACTGPPPPSYSSDAFKGLYNQSSASVPADAPISVQQPVGIIFSDNVETYFGYIKDSTEYWGQRIPSSLTNNVVLADTDPRYFGGKVLAMLKNRFPSSAVVKDFNEATATGKKAVIVIDLRVKGMEPYGDRTTKYDIDAYFFDARMNPVSKLSGHGEHHVPFASADAGVQTSIDAAVAQLDAKIGTLARQ